MGGIEQLAETVATDMEQRLPGQRKTQRGKLALLVATMLEVRSANLMDVAACLPRPAERLDSRYQWIKRFLANARVVSDAVMAPYGREVLARLSAQGQTVVLLIDQTKVSERHQVVMVAVRLGGRALPLGWRAKWGRVRVRLGGRALPLAWRVKETQGAIGFAEQRAALEAAARLLPAGTKPVLMGDRFYGSPDLIAWCRGQGWDWRLRLKQDLLVFEDGGETTLAACFRRGEHRLRDIELTGKRVRTNVAMVHEPAIPNPGSSPCRRRRPSTRPSIMACAGASRPCSPISRAAASGSKTARSGFPDGSTASSWSWRWRCSGRCRPACGMPQIDQPAPKKTLPRQTPKLRPIPHLLVQARAPAHPHLPSSNDPPPTSLDRMAHPPN